MRAVRAALSLAFALTGALVLLALALTLAVVTAAAATYVLVPAGSCALLVAATLRRRSRRKTLAPPTPQGGVGVFGTPASRLGPRAQFWGPK